MCLPLGGEKELKAAICLFFNLTPDRPESNKYEINYGIEEQKNITDGIKNFPNPFIDVIEVEIQNPEQSAISIQLIDLNGKSLLYEIENSASTTQNFSYQLNNEPAGIYCFKITIGNNIYTYKIEKL